MAATFMGDGLIKAGLIAGAVLCWAARAVAADLTVLVDASAELPWAHLQNETVASGIHRDLGEALAQQLGREARFLVLPRKRVTAALAAGQADIYCAALPGWLPGPFGWSRAFLPISELVLSLASAPRPAALADLAGVPIGTVSGFIYPELERQLGGGLVRDDGPNASANLRKLVVGRVKHATSDQLFVDYQRRIGQLNVPLHPYLVFSSYQTRCAVSRHSRVGVAQLDVAITALVNAGTMHALLAQYR